jgi:hypothetical protein
MTPAKGGVAVYDAGGLALPVEPSAAGGLDVPLVAARDTALLRLLGTVQAEAPRLFARISEVRRAAGASGARDEFEFTVTTPGLPGVGGVTTVVVRAMADVSVGRLADLVPVETDLQRRRDRPPLS